MLILPATEDTWVLGYSSMRMPRVRNATKVRVGSKLIKVFHCDMQWHVA